MKRIICFLSITLLALTSCKDDDTTVYPVNPESPKDLLIGKWKMVKGEMYTNGELTYEEDLKLKDCDYDFYDLKKDGIKDEAYHDEDDCALDNYVGKWSFVEPKSQLTLIDDEDGYEMLFEVVSITKTDLKVKLLVDDGIPTPKNIDVFTYLKK